MADSESEANSKSSSPKSKSTKVNFVLLKQILDDESSEFTDSDDQQSNCKENQSNTDRKLDSPTKPGKEQDSCGPIGRYPVTFSKRCKSKSCQTRLSAFPLFSVPEDTEWISEEEENCTPKKERRKSVDKKKSQRIRTNSSSDQVKSEKKKESEKALEKTKNADGTRKDFHSEHQLKDTKNPLIQAWIQSKNKLSRKAKREERREKRAQRAALVVEERLKMEKHEFSDKRVKEWFKVKRKEARKLWKQNHPKVSPFEMAFDDQTEDSPPPPDYKVVKTFKQKHSSFKPRRSSSASNSSRITKDHDVDTVENKIDISDTICHSDNKSHQTQRPKTASYSRPDAKTKKSTRPKTAKPNSKNEITSTKDEPFKQMKSLSYDEWLRSKRELDKKKVIERRRELIDSHLDSVISKLGKQRVENIMFSRKHIDTGLKNFSRTSPKSPLPQKKDSYKWKKGHDVPRPEPQGCDCPESEHIDSDKSKTVFSQINHSPTTPRRKANEFCKEVTDKCEELKPSVDKVLAVLDSEIKKCSAEIKSQSKTSKPPSSLVSTANATCNDTENAIEMLSLPGTVEEGPPSRPKSARPKSARPNLVNNTNLTKDEAKKKIFHDMDVLGLCCSDQNLGNGVTMTTKGNSDSVVVVTTDTISDTVVVTSENFDNTVAMLPDKSDSRSTVRSNYFDYGTNVDVPTMK